MMKGIGLWRNKNEKMQIRFSSNPDKERIGKRENAETQTPCRV